MKKLRLWLIISNLVGDKQLIKLSLMHNHIANFVKVLDIIKDFAGNRVNELGNIPRRGVIPKFSALKVIVLSAMVEAIGIDSENLLFKRLEAEKGDLLPNLISRRQYNQRRKLTSKLGEDIRKDIAFAMDGREDVFSIDSLPAKVCQNVRANRCIMGRDDLERASAWGYCMSQGVHSFDMTAVNVHDLHYLKDAKWEYHDCMMLGDKGYLSAAIQLDLSSKQTTSTSRIPTGSIRKTGGHPHGLTRGSESASRRSSPNSMTSS